MNIICTDRAYEEGKRETHAERWMSVFIYRETTRLSWLALDVLKNFFFDAIFQEIFEKIWFFLLLQRPEFDKSTWQRQAFNQLIDSFYFDPLLRLSIFTELENLGFPNISLHSDIVVSIRFSARE